MRKSLLSRAFRLALALCSVLAIGVVVPGAEALATGGPEAPLTDECVGVITPGSVRICGILNPHTYAKAGYYFEYNQGAECTGGDTTPIEAEVEGQDIAVSAELTGLEPSTEYSYCLVATNPFGETVSHPAGSPAGPPPPEAPVTEAASEITGTTATLNGELNPHASAKAGYYFMYNTGASCTGGSRTPAKAEVEGEGIAVSANLTGLSPGTKYTDCLVATNPSGTTFGQPLTATTLATASPPEAPITEVCGGPMSPGIVRLCGTLNPHARAKTGFYFAYNEGSSCEGGDQTQPEQEAEVQALKVSSEPTGLKPGTEYTYCLVATNSHGETFGEGLTFKTEGEPIVESEPHEVQTESAEQTVHGFKLKGKLNPENSPTRYYFIYKKAGEVECEDLEGCGPETAHGGPLSGDTQQEVPPMEVTDLTPGATYVYWLIAWNAKGAVRGNELTFTTPPVPPSIDSESVSNVTEHDATLEAQINPNGAYTGYEFQIYTDANGEYDSTPNCPFQIPGYGQCAEYVLTPRPPGLYESGPEYIPAGYGDQTVSIDLASIGLTLQSGSTYHYRVITANTAQILDGPDQTFTTPVAQSDAGQGDTTVSGTTSDSLTPLPSTVTPFVTKTLKPKAEVLTNGQKLAKALKTCDKKPKRLRAKCVKEAKDKYGNHAMTTKKSNK